MEPLWQVMAGATALVLHRLTGPPGNRTLYARRTVSGRQTSTTFGSIFTAIGNVAVPVPRDETWPLTRS